jgi:hypothetical protein
LFPIWRLFCCEFGSRETKPARTINKPKDIIVDLNAALEITGPNGIVGDIESGVLTGLSMPSLEMRENVDFLLTPAIIVQECISDDVIVVYPDE